MNQTILSSQGRGRQDTKSSCFDMYLLVKSREENMIGYSVFVLVPLESMIQMWECHSLSFQ